MRIQLALFVDKVIVRNLFSLQVVFRFALTSKIDLLECHTYLMAIWEVIPRFGELTDNKIVLARRVTDSSRLL